MTIALVSASRVVMIGAFCDAARVVDESSLTSWQDAKGHVRIVLLIVGKNRELRADVLVLDDLVDGPR